jgi:hypothetical protein
MALNDPVRYRGMFWKAVWSGDDDGWYCELFNEKGEDIMGGATHIYDTIHQAERAAKTAIDNYFKTKAWRK